MAFVCIATAKILIINNEVNGCTFRELVSAIVVPLVERSGGVLLE